VVQKACTAVFDHLAIDRYAGRASTDAEHRTVVQPRRFTGAFRDLGPWHLVQPLLQGFGAFALGLGFLAGLLQLALQGLQVFQQLAVLLAQGQARRQVRCAGLELIQLLLQLHLPGLGLDQVGPQTQGQGLLFFQPGAELPGLLLITDCP